MISSALILLSLWVQLPFDISNSTMAGMINQANIASDSPNFPDPAHRSVDALIQTAATLKDPSLAAPPANSPQVHITHAQTASHCLVSTHHHILLFA